MTPFEYFDTVQRAQKEFDVSRLTLGGVNHWMIVRLLMLGIFSREASKRAVQTAGIVSHSRVIDNPLSELRSKDMSPTSYSKRVLGEAVILMEPRSAAGSPAKLVFYELPADYTQIIDGKAVNRIADGFSEAFGNQVRKVCRFAPDMLNKSCRVEPSYVFLAPPRLAIDVEEREKFSQAVRDFCSYLGIISPDFSLTPAVIMQNVTTVLTQSAAHEAWISELAPELVAFQCFISMEKIGVLIACKRLGIPTMEVQHGFCDANSIFNEMPEPQPGVFDIYTDIFWTWGERTASALKRDSGGASLGVKVIAGGDVWGALSTARAKAARDAFLLSIGSEKYSRRVLVAHQIEALVHTKGSNSLVSAVLIDAMRLAPKDWLWMVRVHPRSSHLITPIRQTLSDAGIVNCEVELTSLETIEVVLEAADVFLTGFSVSALEANAVGKPVIILDEVGKRLFGDAMESGSFEFAETAKEICQLIADSRPPTSDYGYYKRDVEHSRRSLGALLNESTLAAAV